MHINILRGDDTRLYPLVGPLVMNHDVLAYNRNYPFRTSSDYVWFIACGEQEEVAGFMPVQFRRQTATINNYYVAGDRPEVFSLLLARIVADLTHDLLLSAVVQTRHEALFAESGFDVTLRWTRYVKMFYPRHATKRL